MRDRRVRTVVMILSTILALAACLAPLGAIQSSEDQPDLVEDHWSLLQARHSHPDNGARFIALVDPVG